MRPFVSAILFASSVLSSLADGPVWSFGVDGGGRFGVVAASSAGVASVSVPADWSGEPVRAIGEGAFAACDGLVEVRIPASVEWIDPCAFDGCSSLQRIVVEAGSAGYSSEDGLLFDGAGGFLLNCPQGRTGRCVIPNGTLEIDAKAFAGCRSLVSVVIPSGVVRAGADVFSGCTGLKTVYLATGSSCSPAAMGVPASCAVVRYAPGGLDDPTLPPRWAVRFHANGGAGSMARQVFKTGVKGALRANAFGRKGHVFAGWSKTKTGSIAFKDKAAVRDLAATGGTIRLYAVWAVRKYKVSFQPNGGTGTMPVQSFVYGTPKRLRANAFKRKGWTFTGWSRKASAAATIENRQRVSTLTRKGATVKLFAKWKRNRYSVRFDPNGGKGTMPDEAFAYGKWKALSANAFTRKGKRFLGWSKDPGATRPTWKDQAKIRSLTAKNGKTVVLYAVWAKQNVPGRILCLGDSITEGYACAGLPYPARLANLTGREVVNRGVGGTTSRDGLLTAEANIRASAAGTVCILFGANDAIHGVNPLVTKANLREIVRICRDYGCTPVLGTPSHQSGRHAQFDAQASRIATAIRALGREEGVAVADINTAFGHSDVFLNPNDGLHLSEAGGDRLARTFQRLL